jgi:hypothetical protein
MASDRRKRAILEEFVSGPPVAKGGSASGTSLGVTFHRDVQRIRRTLIGMSRRGRRSRRATASAAAATVVSSDLVARMQFGLKKEHDYVLEPLLARLESYSDRLMLGQDVPTAEIERGLALVDRYLRELHDGHLMLLDIADADPAKGDPARLALGQLVSDHDHARIRWATVRLMFRGYQAKVAGYRALFGLTLAQECRAERQWHEFEEKFVRTSVARRFTPQVAETWQGELDRAREEGRADRLRISEYLQSTPLDPPTSP